MSSGTRLKFFVNMEILIIRPAPAFQPAPQPLEFEPRNVLKPPCMRAPRKTDCENPSLRCLLISERDVVCVLYLA